MMNERASSTCLPGMPYKHMSLTDFSAQNAANGKDEINMVSSPHSGGSHEASESGFANVAANAASSMNPFK